MALKKAYLAYATANDRFGHILDAANFERMCALPSGTEEIHVAIAVSEARRRRRRHELWYDRLAQRLEKTGRFNVAALYFKPNKGRDFSSWFSAYDRLRAVAGEEELILMLNRSAFGPLQDNWYAQFAEPFAAVSNLGICGVTANFQHTLHIQTYAWMTRMKVLEALKEEHPGKYALSRKEAIFNGELMLSRRIMALGYSLTSLAWPGKVFDWHSRQDFSLPQYNIALEIQSTPFRHWEKKDIRYARLSLSQYVTRLFGWPSL
jgi:hypothetical protein